MSANKDAKKLTVTTVYKMGQLLRKAVTYKNKYTLTTWPINPTPRCLSYRNDNICLHMITYSSFIQNHIKRKTLEMTQMPSVCEWMNQMCCMHAIELLNNKKEWIMDTPEQHRWMSGALCWIKEISFKSLLTTWFHLH